MPEENDQVSESEVIEKKSKRYEWLDQFRGIVVVLLIVSTITWELSGDFLTMDPIIGPTFLNHGWQYFEGYPPIITLIDIGQQIFMFILGYVGYLSFKSRLDKGETKIAWKYAIRRVALLYVLALLDDGILSYATGGSFSIKDVLYNGTFANLAIGSLAAYISAYFINNADKRMISSVMILTFHSIMYSLPFFEHYHTQQGIPFPFNAINHMAIAIAGTSFAQWFKLDPNDPKKGFKTRILPAATLSFVGCYCIDFIQYAEHHDVSTSLALMAIGTSGFMIAIFYGFEQLEFKIPLLSEFGRNMLLMFILTSVIGFYLGIFSKEFLIAVPLLTMILVGMLPIIALGALAVLLDRKSIIIKV